MRELEDLLIDAIYCDIIQGKLDQRNQQVEVDCSVGRDLGPNELPNIISTLQEWSVLGPGTCVCVCNSFRQTHSFRGSRISIVTSLICRRRSRFYLKQNISF